MGHDEARQFNLQLVRWQELHELPDDWPAVALREVLTELEIEGVGDDELLEMTIMGLQDRELDEAADLVLRVVFGAEMSAGIRQNLVNDLQEDRPWEEFADIRRQRGIFTAITLLQRAFPRQYGVPDLARVELTIEAKTPTGLRWLQGEVDPALLLRLLAAGMGERAILRRLFGDALAGDHFPEAASILWRLEILSEPDISPVQLVLHSSLQWFSALQDLDTWSARGWVDED